MHEKYKLKSSYNLELAVFFMVDVSIYGSTTGVALLNCMSSISTFGNLGNMRLYKLIQTVSLFFIALLNTHFIKP